jgi:hypothetical protein
VAAVRHPSIWKVLRCLKDEQANSEVSVDVVNHGEATPRRRRKWRNLETRIQRLKEEYTDVKWYKGPFCKSGQLKFDIQSSNFNRH